MGPCYVFHERVTETIANLRASRERLSGTLTSLKSQLREVEDAIEEHNRNAPRFGPPCHSEAHSSGDAAEESAARIEWRRRAEWS